MSIGDLSINTKSIEYMKKLRESTYQQYDKVSSGRRYSEFTSMAEDGNVLSALTYGDTVNNLDNYITSNKLSVTRMISYDQALQGVYDINQRLKFALTTFRSSSGPSSGIDLEVNGLLGSLQTLLNQKDDLGYIFSGDNPQKSPIDDIYISNLVDSKPSDNYYKGSGQARITKISDQQELEYGINGNEDGIKNLIGALHLTLKAIESGIDKPDNDLIDKAFVFADDALSELNSLRSFNGNNLKITEKMIDSQITQNLYVNDSLSKIRDTDQAEASITLNRDLVSLQASLIAITKIQEQSLIKYV